MTNKEIIIDGVDVSGCDYIIPPKKQCPMKAMPYAKEASCIACKKHNTKHNFCKNNPNCDYKQYQRLTAQYDKVVEQNKSLQQENVKIKADNSELFKKIVEAQKETDNTLERLQQKQQECESIAQNCEYLNKQNERLVDEKYNLHMELMQVKFECKELKRKYGEEYSTRRYYEDAAKSFQADFLTAQGEIYHNNLNYEEEINHYKQALDEIENFMIYEFSGQNEWVKTSILDIISKAKGKDNE